MHMKQVEANLQKQVLYDGKVYTLLEYVLWLETTYKQQKIRHSLVLQERRGSCTIRVPMDMVQEINETEEV